MADPPNTDEPWKDFAAPTDEPWKDFANEPVAVSSAFQDRVKRGDEITSLHTAFGKAAAAHFDMGTPFGMSDETIDLWRKHGIFADPATGRPGILPREDEAFVQGIAAAGDIALRSIHAGIGGVGGVAANIAQRLGLPEPERLGREVSGELERRMISGDAAVKVHARLEPTREAVPVRSQQVGTIPTAADFRNAADNLIATKAPEAAPVGEVRLYEGYGGKFTRDRLEGATGRSIAVLEGVARLAEKEPGIFTLPEDIAAKARLPDTTAVEAKLRDLWEKRGIHPAEAAHDAALDPFIHQELTQGTVHPAEKVPLESWIEANDNKLEPVSTSAEIATAKAVIDEQSGKTPTQPPIYDPLAMARTGELTADRATEIAAELGGRTKQIEDEILGADADRWRKAQKAADRAFNRGTAEGDRIGEQQNAIIGEIEEKLSGVDQGRLYGKGDLTHTDPTAWKELARDLRDVEFDRKDAIRTVAYKLRDLPDPATPLTESARERLAVIQHAMSEETKRGGDSMQFLKDAFRESGERYGAGADAEELIRGDMEKLQKLMGEPEAPPPLALPAPEVTMPLRGVGADVVRGPMPSLEAQPPIQRGRLMEAGRQAVSNLQGLGRNIQYMLDPMATGSKEAMALAKDTINSVRRIRWEHAQMDSALTKDPGLVAARRRTGESVEKQHTRMWNAADEESVLRQEGAPREHMGLATLEPEERAFIERLHADAQSAWLNAVDAGMVEGEGLPAYTPRMVLNVAAAQEHVGPASLNELGRNVFTRVAQMKHRKYFMAEETEAAAKELVRRRLTERGLPAEEVEAAVEKVQIARNIRALPLATAKLQEAAIWHDMIRQIEEIGKATGREVVAEYNPGGWFTIAGNPAFSKWAPVLEKNPVTGKWGARVDDAGQPIMVRKPIYMPPEFKGPMTAILDESASRNKLVQGASTLYGGLMALKGRSMLMILNSPLIHNAVVWGKVVEAVSGKEWLGFGLYNRGNRLVNGPKGGRASELIQRGLNPMGPRGSFQDINAIMESPDIMSGYHKSWTGRVLGAVPGLFDEAAGVAVEKAIAKAGNFWHNTLLWDRVRDLQFGLADHLSDHIVAKGADRVTADRIAAHFSNIVVGSIPKEAMSNGAAATANMMLFSRSFTLGNIATYKQAAMGIPKPILAQIEKQFGMPAEAALGKEAAAAVTQTAQSIARKKAASMLGLSVTMYYTGNALLQNALNIVMRDSTIDEEMKGYARRYLSFMTDVAKNPFELRHLVGRLSPVYENEPDKQDRVHIGYDKDGTAYYGRNPVGKYGEEVIGYPSHPMKMVRQKLSPTVGGLLDVLENDKGFGRKVYDEHDTSNWATAKTAFAVAKHLVMKHLPENQIMAGVDLLHDDGDRQVNALRFVAPVVGFTVSKGAPGGIMRGEQLAAKQDFDARFGVAWPDIRKKIQAGNVEQAIEDMNALRVPNRMQHGLIRNAQNPSGALRGRTLRDFYQYATPEQIERFEGARERAAPRIPAPGPALAPPPIPMRMPVPQTHMEGEPILQPGLTPRG